MKKPERKNLKHVFASALCALALICSGIIPSSILAASVSELLISEIMINPLKTSDSSGEWLELFNPSSSAVELSGITLSDLGSNSHEISPDTSLLIMPGEYFVLARSGNMDSNGGFDADYVYGSSFSLSNTGDEIIFSDLSGELLRLDYAAGFAVEGASMELLSDIMLPENYIASSSTYGLGDFGTPGSEGSYGFTAGTSPVPLPAALWLFIAGLVSLLSIKRSGRKPDQLALA